MWLPSDDRAPFETSALRAFKDAAFVVPASDLPRDSPPTAEKWAKYAVRLHGTVLKYTDTRPPPPSSASSSSSTSASGAAAVKPTRHCIGNVYRETRRRPVPVGIPWRTQAERRGANTSIRERQRRFDGRCRALHERSRFRLEARRTGRAPLVADACTPFRLRTLWAWRVRPLSRAGSASSRHRKWWQPLPRRWRCAARRCSSRGRGRATTVTSRDTWRDTCCTATSTH